MPIDHYGRLRLRCGCHGWDLSKVETRQKNERLNPMTKVWSTLHVLAVNSASQSRKIYSCHSLSYLVVVRSASEIEKIIIRSTTLSVMILINLGCMAIQ